MSDEVSDLKEVLTSSLEENGVLRQVKAKLRAEVFAAMNDPHSVVQPPLSNTNLVINELIREYLAYNGYIHTLNVLIPESGQPEESFEKTFLANELNIKLNSHARKVPLLYTVLAMLQAEEPVQDINHKEEEESIGFHNK